MTPYAILGTGDVAKSLARGLRGLGHPVMLAGRDAAKTAATLADFAGETGSQTGSYAQAAAFGQTVVLAVKGHAAAAVLDAAGSALNGKLLIDATNPIEDATPEHGVLRFFTGPNDSLGERLQQAFPSLRIVKAFNTVGAAHFVQPRFAGGPGSMFIAGNDAEAKAEVAALVRAFGWEPYDCGRIEGARATEPLCQLWCLPGLLRGDWAHAFKVIAP
ncbi:NADPH-dependent F420 reductase [Inhella proteolytica]|uniref:NAD(P)-binding domain-containing protein n=1 Tax=Inhella proteolytica TaxID=2795029 RepID=A0A931J6G9_9BURK|nr:NAD(P)-binding domain-containing protein [Inhella proteolytica]MBH9579146.1 NAD(P)-binding domain-containing protein [Inhella proteolytica]